MASFAIKKTYNFNLISDLAPILGTTYNLMKVKAITTSDTALLYKDIATEHLQVSAIKADLPKNISELTYIIFENATKDTMVFPLEYIDQNSIKEVQAITIKVEIGKCSTSDITVIQRLIKEAGYTDLNIQAVGS